jgi:hypothetical protein
MPTLWDHRRAWILAGLIFLLMAAGSLDQSSYFLHHDTPRAHVNGADLVQGCWGTSGKPAAAMLLGLLFAVTGVNPLGDTILLALAGAAMVAAFFSLAAHLTGSKRRGMLAALWLISLPTLIYYTRYHIGYPLACFVAGLLLFSRRRYGWAGLLFGIALPLHANFAVPVAAWLGWSVLLDKQSRRVGSLLRVGAGMAASVLAVETVRFLFIGQPLGWTLGMVRAVERHYSMYTDTTWLHIWEVVRFSNGWLNALLLLTGLVYPAVRRRGAPLLDAAYLAGWSIVVAYTLRGGLAHTELVPRMLAGVYPLLVLAAVFTLTEGASRLAEVLRPQARAAARLAAGAMIAIGLPVAMINHTLDAAVASRTAYPQIDQAMAEAAEAGLAVRYFGNRHVGGFFGLRHGVEVVVDERPPDEAIPTVLGNTRAVLIFEGTPAYTPPTLADLRAALPDAAALYTITTYPNMVRYRPFTAEEGRLGTADFRRLDGLPYAREAGADVGLVEIWWPRNPQGTFEVGEGGDPTVTGPGLHHYRGEGCISTRRYGDGTQNYYHVLGGKAGEVWAALTEGGLREALEVIRSAVEE